MAIIRIGIGICTYKRIEKLDKCLNSLASMKQDFGPGIRIIIADNDTNGSARALTNKFADRSSIPVSYEIEHKRGIAQARNNVLHRAKSLGISELAFIDDDEYVSEDWLVHMYQYYMDSGADVVRGPVKTVYPDHTPQWVVDGGFYQRTTYETGQVFQWANTGNVFFNFNKLVNAWGLCFDPSYQLTGGEDMDFFSRAYDKGALIVWTNNAIVYETLDEKCFRPSYLLKRRFREHNDKHHFKNWSLGQSLKTFFAILVNIIKHILLLPVHFFYPKHVRIKRLEKIAESAGYLMGLLGITIRLQEYK